jgi:hypothetical protein
MKRTQFRGKTFQGKSPAIQNFWVKKKPATFAAGLWVLPLSAWDLPTRHKYFQLLHLKQELDLSLRYQPL